MPHDAHTLSTQSAGEPILDDQQYLFIRRDGLAVIRNPLK